MNWQDDHKHRVAAFPKEIRLAHEHSARHRAEIVSSESCGCFYCCSVFPPDRITEWIDDDPEGLGQTALCPHCGIDSVIGDRSGFEINPEFLRRMKTYWFSLP